MTMKVSIRSLAGDLKRYKSLLEKKMDYEKHLNLASVWVHPQTKVEHRIYELKDVEINSLEELFAIFDEFREDFGYGGHITIDVKKNIVYVLDSYIE